MARCEIARDCLFFNDCMDVEPQMAALFKVRYCQGSNRECARHMVFAACGRPAVPIDLAPNDKLRARAIVFEGARCREQESSDASGMTTR